MTRVLTIVILLFIQVSPLSAQTIVQGRVVDENTQQPLPFVSIAFENTFQGTITNEHGEFRCSVDTVISKYFRFSCIGYENLRIHTTGISPLNIYLKPISIHLPEIEILAGKRSWVFYLVTEAIKKARKNKSDRQAKSFFSLETSIDELPLEVIEAFYNCRSVPRKGVLDFELKNGRFGLSKVEDLWFINKNPTAILENLSLFEMGRINLPRSPLDMENREIKNRFRFKIDTLLVSGEKTIACISFIPKNSAEDYFSGKIFIDTTTFEIQKVQLLCKAAKKHPFHPLDSIHRISNVQLEFNVSFKKIGNSKPVHDFIRFAYKLDYTTSIRRYEISSKSILVLYDYDNFFILPYFSPPPGLSDYGKILSLPYYPLFWQRNYIIPTSQTAKNYTHYFQQKGMTVNYGDSNRSNGFLPNPVIYWSSDNHLIWDYIPKKNPGWILFADSKRKRNDSEEVASRKYFLDFQIILDFNMESDTCYYQSKAMLFLDNSFYEKQRDTFALKALDLEFEIAELYRYRLDHRIDSVLAFGCDSRKVNRIYDKLLMQFEGMRWLYRKEVKRGQNQLAYETWKKRIDLRLKRAKNSPKN